MTGSPLSKTTSFNLVVSAPSGCPATTALEGAPDRAAMLGLLYEFRDKVLGTTATGRYYISVFYKHAIEGAWLMLRHPELRSSSRVFIERFRPAFQAMVTGRPVSLTRVDMADIHSLLEAFLAPASAGLQSDLRAVQNELQQPGVLHQFGIEIRD